MRSEEDKHSLRDADDIDIKDNAMNVINISPPIQIPIDLLLEQIKK